MLPSRFFGNFCERFCWLVQRRQKASWLPGDCHGYDGAARYHHTPAIKVSRTYITRVQQCQSLSPRPNWDPPTPSLASECVPLPRNQRGGGKHSPAGEGVPIRSLEKKPNTLSSLPCGLSFQTAHREQIQQIAKTMIPDLVLCRSRSSL
jgi:hypothetical protein